MLIVSEDDGTKRMAYIVDLNIIMDQGIRFGIKIAYVFYVNVDIKKEAVKQMTKKQSTSEQLVLLENQEGMGLITLNRPEAMNAIDDATANDLRDAVDRAMNDPGIRVVVFTGAGEKAFAAGSDLRKIQSSTMVEVLSRNIRKLWIEVEQSPKPTIAAVNGFCIGGGLELALSCDIRLASRKAKFSISDANLGFLPGGGAIHRLPKLIGKGKAKEMILMAEIVDAEEAYRVGLVNRVVEPEDLMTLVREYTDKLMKRAPLAQRLGKLAVDVGFESDVVAGSHFEMIAQALLCTTEDKKEGIEAFFDKRKPQFKGK
jgi:enoyl-CoA hydratase